MTGGAAPWACDEVEEPLAGGQVSTVVRVGDTVRRPTGPWTPAVHELLRHLDRASLPLVPQVLGIDGRGREVLTYLPGQVLQVGVDTMTDARLRSAMHWLRSYHELVRGFDRGPRRWRFVERALRPGEIVCHHDFAVYNLAWHGDALSGVFDWDVAGPGAPLDDLAMFAWNGPLLVADPATGLPQGPEPAAAAAGLVTMADAYGGPGPTAVLDHVVTRMTAAARRIEAGQRAGDAGMLRLGEAGEPASTRRRLAVLSARLPAIRALLPG